METLLFKKHSNLQKMIEEKYGAEMIEKLEANGWSFITDAKAPRPESA
jgi:hypothetical protein